MIVLCRAMALSKTPGLGYTTRMNRSVSYEEVVGLLQRDEVSIDAAELQGLLVALLSGQSQVTPADWLSAALGEPMTPGYVDQDAEQTLRCLFESTRGQLEQGEFELRLLLPDDDAALASRAEALVHWGSGYLSGLGHLGRGDFSDWPEDARDFIQDLAEITKADFVHVDEELDEEAFAELVEYARIGALLVFETLRSPGEETVH